MQMLALSIAHTWCCCSGSSAEMQLICLLRSECDTFRLEFSDLSSTIFQLAFLTSGEFKFMALYSRPICYTWLEVCFISICISKRTFLHTSMLLQVSNVRLRLIFIHVENN